MPHLVNSSRRECTSMYDISAELIGYYLIQLEKRYKWNLSNDDIFISFCLAQYNGFTRIIDVYPDPTNPFSNSPTEQLQLLL